MREQPACRDAGAVSGGEQSLRRPTFDLLHDAAKVGVDLVVLGEPEREVVLLGGPERLGRVDAALVQDRVDAEICRHRRTVNTQQNYSYHRAFRDFTDIDIYETNIQTQGD